MKKRIAFTIIMMITILFSITACGIEKKVDNSVSESKKQIVNETDEVVFDETGKDTAQESKNSSNLKKKQLTIQAKPEDDGNPNTEEYIISDESGNSAEVQIGVAEGGEDISDAPDDMKGAPQIINPPTENIESSKEPQSSADTGNIGSGVDTTYEEYEAMSGTEQTIFYYSFADADEFLEWYNDAKAKYEEENEEIYIGLDGVVNAGESD